MQMMCFGPVVIVGDLGQKYLPAAIFGDSPDHKMLCRINVARYAAAASHRRLRGLNYPAKQPPLANRHL